MKSNRPESNRLCIGRKSGTAYANSKKKRLLFFSVYLTRSKTTKVGHGGRVETRGKACHRDTGGLKKMGVTGMKLATGLDTAGTHSGCRPLTRQINVG